MNRFRRGAVSVDHLQPMPTLVGPLYPERDVRPGAQADAREVRPARGVAHEVVQRAANVRANLKDLTRREGIIDAQQPFELFFQLHAMHRRAVSSISA